MITARLIKKIPLSTMSGYQYFIYEVDNISANSEEIIQLPFKTAEEIQRSIKLQENYPVVPYMDGEIIGFEILCDNNFNVSFEYVELNSSQDFDPKKIILYYKDIKKEETLSDDDLHKVYTNRDAVRDHNLYLRIKNSSDVDTGKVYIKITLIDLTNYRVK